MRPARSPLPRPMEIKEQELEEDKYREDEEDDDGDDEEDGFSYGSIGSSQESSSGDEDEEDNNEEDGVGELEDMEKDDVVVNGTAHGGVEEMEELEKEYLSIQNEQQNLLTNLKRQKDEDLLKGEALKNQKTLWLRSLEFRFLLQKAFSCSNRLPQEPIKSLLCNSDESVSQAYADLITSSKQALSCLADLQEALIAKNSAVNQGDNGKLTDLEDQEDEEWLRISRSQQRIIPFRNSAIDKWHRKTQVTTGAAAFKGKFQAFNQNISDQVVTYMRDPDRMIRRMQLKKTAVCVLGEVSEDAGSRKEEEENTDGDPNLIDDSEFYQQLLKEFFESSDLASSETAYYTVKKMQTKKRKAVDRRASKSRKIRYNVHEKIVNFMAPKPTNFNDMGAKLFENLFGRKIQKSTTVT